MIKFAIVGCGRIAQRHASLLGGALIENARLSCVCDLNLDLASRIGDKYGVNYYQDINQMLINEEVDVVVILTESGTHYSVFKEVINYKKHIIVEKPMALKLSDAENMIMLAKQNDVKLFVVKQNRFNTPIKFLHEAVSADKFGKIFLGTVRIRWCRTQEYYDLADWRGTWLNDGGVLTNQASHHVDLLQWMMGEVSSVFAKSDTANVNIEAEDTIAAVLRFKSGAIGIIEATTATRPRDLEGSMSILGEQGSAEIGGFAVNEVRHWHFNNVRGDDFDSLEKNNQNPPNVYGFGHKEYYDHVIKNLQSQSRTAIDGAEGIKSLKIIHAVYKSIETGKEISMDGDITSARLGK